MLKTFIDDIRSGKRESAAMSNVSTGSLSLDEEESWRALRKELQSIGITPDLFTQHRPFIINTLQTLMTQGEIADIPKKAEVERLDGRGTGHGIPFINPDSPPQARKQARRLSRPESCVADLLDANDDISDCDYDYFDSDEIASATLRSSHVCPKCNDPMTGMYVHALGRDFHLDCFKCEVSSSLKCQSRDHIFPPFPPPRLGILP